VLNTPLDIINITAFSFYTYTFTIIFVVMIKTILTFFISISTCLAQAQSWTASQLDAANTAKDIDYLADIEKATIQYINLARLYPQLFVANELDNYNGPSNFPESVKNSAFKKSLIKELKTRKPVGALQFDKSMYDLAACFAKESGKGGLVTHKRRSCPYGYMGECCSYGMLNGKDIAMQWLIDDGIGDLGHRINCLTAEYSVIGISTQPHKKYRTCAVADFK
jgi:hypothetical protein